MVPETVILDPTAVSNLTLDSVRPRDGSLAGLTIGVIDNTKPNFDVFAKALTAGLIDRFGLRDAIHRQKSSVNVEAGDEIYSEMKLRTALVIAGSGD